MVSSKVVEYGSRFTQKMKVLLSKYGLKEESSVFMLSQNSDGGVFVTISSEKLNSQSEADVIRTVSLLIFEDHFLRKETSEIRVVHSDFQHTRAVYGEFMRIVTQHKMQAGWNEFKLAPLPDEKDESLIYVSQAMEEIGKRKY